MRIIRAQQGQSLFDLAVQEMGSVSGVMEIAVLNNMSLTVALIPGQELRVPDGVINPDVVADLRMSGIRPASTINEFGSAAETFYAVPEYVEINYWL